MITNPARKIPRRYTGVSGSFPSIKNQRLVSYESPNERDYMLLLEFDDAIDRYVEQPIRIPYTLSSEKGNRQSRYTPDILVYFLTESCGNVRSPELIEVKLKEELKRKEEEQALKFAAAKAVAESHQWVFKVVTEDHFRGPIRENADFLYQFKSNQPVYPIEDEVINFVTRHREPVPGTDIFDAFSEKFGGVGRFAPIFWGMVARKVVATDWNQIINIDSSFSAGRLSNE